MLRVTFEIKENGSSMRCLVNIDGEDPTPQEIIYAELLEDGGAERLEFIDKTYRVDNSHGQNVIQKEWSEQILKSWRDMGDQPKPKGE